MRVTTRRRLFIIAVSAAVILAVGYGFMPKPVAVDVIKAVRGPMKVTIEEEGKTRVKDRFVISAPVAGFLRRIELKVGDQVEKKQIIAELEPLRSAVLDPRSRAEAEAAVASASAVLNAAEETSRAAAAAAEYAGKSWTRQKGLFEAGYISRDQLDLADSEATRTEANRLAAAAAVKRARAELEKARAVLRYSAAEKNADKGKIVTLHAPVDGRVLKLHHESEGVVNSGEPLVDVGDPLSLEVRVEVLSADAVNITAGTPVLFERWGGDAPLSGKVRIVEPEAFTKVSSLGVEEQRVLVIADITSMPESWQRLGDGYRVDANFIIWEGADVLQVPSSALFRQGEKWAVFAVENKKARTRPVKVGRRNGLVAEVLSGVVEGEAVITHPDESVRNGTRVRPR